jgi:uncharacterized protein YqjF (DUF2071 family)
VRFTFRARHLVLASWDTEPERVARVLPPGLRPAAVDGRHLVSIAAFRAERPRLGALPLPPYSQLNVRAYVEHDGGTAVFFLAARVTALAMGAALLGVPVRPARLRVRAGVVDAPGLGVSLRYEAAAEAEPSEVTGHLAGVYEAAGLRAFTIRRGEATWRRAEPTQPVRAEPLVALGFDVSRAPELLYAAGAPFEAEVPPRRLSR